MTLLFPSPQFDDAVAAVCHGVATEEQMAALNELLRNNPAARDKYLIRVEVHSRLASQPDLFLEITGGNEGNDLPSVKSGAKSNIIPLDTAAPKSTQILRRALALAASLALIGAAAWGWWARHGATRSEPTSPAVAMLTRVVDAHWNQAEKPLRVGDALKPGWLRLDSGMAQVVFYSGARVVLKGPAQLQLVSPMEAVCATGRLLAEVPKPAHGFRVKTAQMDVVDLGTAFGIDATGGRTEVDIFQGMVEFKAGTAAKQSLVQGLAAVVEGNAPAHLAEANPEEFKALLDLEQKSLASEAIRYDQWRLKSAQLNQDPSLVVHLDLQNLSDTDWTLPNASERNRTVLDATIIGCQRAGGRWPEKQSLEFQNVNDRVRLAVPGQFESLTLSAWVRLNGLDRPLNSLFMCDGFDVGGIHWLIRNDGVLSLTVKGQGARNSDIIASPPVLTRDKLETWTHLAVVIDGKNMRVVHYVNGNPVSQHALRLGPPFQIGSAELGNWNAEAGPDPEPSLVRNLNSSLDEFELFNGTLSDAEVHDLYMEGKPQLDP